MAEWMEDLDNRARGTVLGRFMPGYVPQPVPLGRPRLAHRFWDRLDSALAARLPRSMALTLGAMVWIVRVIAFAVALTLALCTVPLALLGFVQGGAASLSGGLFLVAGALLGWTAFRFLVPWPAPDDPRRGAQIAALMSIALAVAVVLLRPS